MQALLSFLAFAAVIGLLHLPFFIAAFLLR